MANQAIALQARAPQSAGLGPAIQQNAQVINMMAQQRAAERQAAQAQQAMDIEAAKEARAVQMSGPQLDKAKADALAASLDVNSKQAVLVKRDLGVIRSGDINAISSWRERATQLLPEWANILPAAEDIARDRNLQLTIASTIDKIIDKEIASPVATLQLTPDNQAVSVTVGGMRPGGELLNIGREGSAAAPRATPTAPMGGPVDETAAPMGGGDTRSLSQVISSALETGVMAKTDFDKLISIAQPESRAKIADWVRSNNIEVMDTPGEMRVSPMSYDGQTPQSEFAVYRGEPMQSRTASLRDAPTMQQTMAQSGGQPLIIKTPTPPGANVAPEVLGSQKAAETAAAKNVELRMAPQIAAATKKAERAVEKRSEALVAKNESKTLVQGLDNYINSIDELLRSPDRHKIVGRIEGNLHYLGSFGQNERQAELQAMYDRIKNTDTLTSLVAMKQASPSGGSPVGNASNQDVQLVAKGANALTQTGGVPKFDQELIKLRRQAYRARQNAIEFYNDRYGDLTSEDPKFKLNVSPIADRYINPKDLRSRRKTPTGGKPSLDSFRR